MTQNPTTVGQLADELAAIAEQLRAAAPTTAPHQVGAYLTLHPAGLGAEDARVATVDHLAELLGLTATYRPGNGWADHDTGYTDYGPIRLRVNTHVTPRTRHCTVCGAPCHHTRAEARA